MRERLASANVPFRQVVVTDPTVFRVEGLRAADAPAFRDFLNERGQRFLEEVDAWLHGHRAAQDDSGAEQLRLGVGVYSIEGQLPEGQ